MRYLQWLCKLYGVWHALRLFHFVLSLDFTKARFKCILEDDCIFRVVGCLRSLILWFHQFRLRKLRWRETFVVAHGGRVGALGGSTVGWRLVGAD